MKHWITFLIVFFSNMPLQAQWTNNTLLNLQASSYTSSVILSESDSRGGTFIAFYKPNGAGSYDMCVQYLDLNGVKQFGADGITLTSYPNNSATFVFNVMVDAQGFFIVCFQDQRNASPNATVAYKINRFGQSLWETNAGTGDGLMLGTGLSPYPCQLTDGDYMFAWNNTTNNRINYQKVIASTGQVAWATAKEILPITSGRTISRPQLVAHTSNNWGMVFQQRNGTVGSPTPTTLFEKQFDSSGTVLWTSTALANYVTSSTRYYTVFSTGDVTYINYYANPSGQNRFDALLQRVNGDGTMPWGINGSDFATDQAYYEMTSNAVFNSTANEVWAVCTYSNAAQSQYGIFTQRFDATTGARLLSAAAQQVYAVSANTEQQPPSRVSICGEGELIFMFYDVTTKIYASKINSSGALVWPGGKAELAGTTNNKFRYNFTGVSGNQSVLVWQETRLGTDNAYAQNISCDGLIGPIPVKMEYFTGAKQGANNLLNWKVSCTNIPSATLSLERGPDSRHFSSIYSITASALRCLDAFSYSDPKPMAGINYYRLKMTDPNGVVGYSNIVALLNKKSGVEIINCTPDPVAGGTFKLNVSTSHQIVMDIYITDVQGRLVQKNNHLLIDGFTALEMKVNDLAKGTYHIYGMTSEGRTKTLVFVKQ